MSILSDLRNLSSGRTVMPINENSFGTESLNDLVNSFEEFNLAMAQQNFNETLQQVDLIGRGILNENIGDVMEELNEKLGESIKNKISKVFTFIKELFAKFRDSIRRFKDSFSKNSQLYWSKYEKIIKDKKFKSTFKHSIYEYDVAKITGFKVEINADDIISDLKIQNSPIKDPEAFKSEVMNELGKIDKNDSDLTEKIDRIKTEKIQPLQDAISDGDLFTAYAKTLAASELHDTSKDKFRENLDKYFRGGSSKTTKAVSSNDVESMIKANETLNSIETEYNTAEKNLNSSKTKLENILKIIERDKNNLKSDSAVGVNRAYELTIEYMNIYLSIYQELAKYSQTVNASKVNAINDCSQQGLKIAKAMVAYNESTGAEYTSAELFDMYEEEVVVDLFC